MNIKVLALLGFAFLIQACNQTIPFADVKSDDLYLVESSTERTSSKEKYFGHEFKQINNRRGGSSADSTKPESLIGLALSGGGIRSSAYQLGLLSGLHNSGQLAKIDYISSVSGGSWANGSYWSSIVPDAELFECLNKAALKGKANANCKSASLLNTKQPFAALPIQNGNLKSRKRQWREHIESVYLPDCNVSSASIEDNGIEAVCSRNYHSKPYMIINATHSVAVFDQKASERNMPFQYTADYIGTLSDCYRSSCDDEKSGFFVKTISNDFAWVNKSLFKKDKPRNSLSAAMAASSGVVAGAVMLSYKYELLANGDYSILGNYNGDNIAEIRRDIWLSDGGKSENLGLVSLIERGVDTIVVSYMGKDKDLKNDPWEDLDWAVNQAKNLLNCDVGKPASDADLKDTFVHVSKYKCPNHEGKIIHVKASHDNSAHFVSDLENGEAEDLFSYLKITDVRNNKDEPAGRFPQTKTMKREYDEELIRSYYLFGQWMAEKKLPQVMNK